MKTLITTALLLLSTASMANSACQKVITGLQSGDGEWEVFVGQDLGTAKTKMSMFEVAEVDGNEITFSYTRHYKNGKKIDTKKTYDFYGDENECVFEGDEYAFSLTDKTPFSFIRFYGEDNYGNKLFLSRDQ